jgi:PAS domain S-box-containing protein
MSTHASDPTEQWFRALMETAPVMIWMSGEDGLCTHFNAAWLAYTGRSLAQERGDGWAKGVHPEDLQRCLDTYRTAFSARVPFRMEYRLRRADGEFGWVLDDGAPRFTDAGVFLGYIGSCVDVTDQKRVERALRTQTVTRALARRLLHDLLGRARVPDGVVRDFGRSLALEVDAAKTPGAFAETYEDMGFGLLRLHSHEGVRFEFRGADPLERQAEAIAPTCHLTLGFLEGAVAAMTGRRALGSEMRCQSMGHGECHFIVMAQ